MLPLRFVIFFAILFNAIPALCQQDVDFYVTNHFLAGNKILKVYQNTQSIYVYVLAPNNTIYLINTNTNSITNISSQFAAYNNFKFIDIASPADNELFVATSSPNVIFDNNGSFSVIGPAQGMKGNVTSIGYLASGAAVSSDNPNTLYIGTDAGMCFYNPGTTTVGFIPLYYTGQVYITNYRVGMFTYTEILTNPGLVGVAMKGNPGSTYGAYIWNSAPYGNINTALNDFPTLGLSYQADPFLVFFYWGTANGLYQTPFEGSQ